MNLKIGTSLQGGRYKIEEILGQGGFGITYLATQVMASRKVCIKEYFPKDYYKRDEDSTTISLLSPSQSETMSRFRDKFIKEAQTIATLDHPHIIHIFDVFEENNTCYYVMEYIEGESLNSVIKRNGALDEAKAINYIRYIASALDHIHEQKINHLDVKPGNIMVRAKDDRVILIDFGLSKHYDNSGDQTSSTPVGISHGYAPMEQYQVGGVSSFSPATDIYSLGATLYYIVTGKVPPQATVVGEEGIGTLPEHLSPGTRKAIEAAMSFWRKDRPKSITEFLQILDSNTPTAVPTTNESWGCAEISDKQPKRTPRNNTGEMESADDAKTKVAPVHSDDNKTHIEATKLTTVTPKAKGVNTTTEAKTDNNRSNHNHSKVWWIIFILLAVGVVAMVVISKQGPKKDRGNEIEHYQSEEPYEIKGSVYDMTGDAQISWEVTSLKVEDGRYKIRFVGEIEDGFHGYPMDHFSAPIFFIGDDYAEVAASEISEPLAAQLVDHHGEMVYKGNVEYVFYVDGNSGEYLQGSVMATICSDEENFCTQADHTFEVRLQ